MSERMPSERMPMSAKQLGFVFEVYARIGLAPERAVHLLRRQGVFVTTGHAKEQIYQARRRNRLRLVFKVLPPH